MYCKLPVTILKLNGRKMAIKTIYKERGHVKRIFNIILKNKNSKTNEIKSTLVKH